MLKAHVGFVVLTLNSLWSFLEDRSENEGKHDNGHGKMMNLTSSAAFALMAMSLSKLQLGFEVGVSNFLFGCFLVTLMKMSFKLAPLAAFFCYLYVPFLIFCLKCVHNMQMMIQLRLIFCPLKQFLMS